MTPAESAQNTEPRTDIQYSDEQINLVNLVEQQIQYSKNPNSTNVPHKLTIVQGKAGSGKSTIIKVIVHRGNQEWPNSVAVAAPTGLAALNIDGKTLHSLFKISPKDTAYKPLAGEALAKLQEEFKNIRFLIIDEMSMVGLKMLYYLCCRCQEAKGCMDPFGGLYVWMFGDFRQLPPVMDRPMYDKQPAATESLRGKLVFNQFTNFVELQMCHRQSGPEAQAFRIMLDNIASGTSTTKDFNLMMTRRKSVLSQNTVTSFDNATHLFPTNNQVIRHNDEVLRKTMLPVARIVSHNVPDYRSKTSKSIDEDMEEGLLHIIKLQVGNRVMLRTNISVSHGLVNGSLGTVRAIVYGEGELPPLLPQYIMVEFDGYTGPTLPNYPGLFPIVPVTRQFKKGSTKHTRTQLPIMLAYASTIHKAQGLTLDKVVVDVGSAEMAMGLTYVALSRVRKLENLMIASAFTKSRLDDIAKGKDFAERAEFIREKFGTQVEIARGAEEEEEIDPSVALELKELELYSSEDSSDEDSLEEEEQKEIIEELREIRGIFRYKPFLYFNSFKLSNSNLSDSSESVNSSSSSSSS